MGDNRSGVCWLDGGVCVVAGLEVAVLPEEAEVELDMVMFDKMPRSCFVLVWICSGRYE